MKKNKNPLFTPAQIDEELQRQNIIPLKGEIGAYILYETVIDYHRNGIKSLPPKIFRHCGINILNLRIPEISIGEFYLKKNILNNYVISINMVVQDYYSKKDSGGK